MAEVRLLAVAAPEDGMRLDRWLRRRWPQLNQVQIHRLARSGQIRMDGARVKADTRVRAGATVRVPPLDDAPPPAPRETISARDAAFARSLVIFEDDQVLALNKPSGLAVQGGTKTLHHVDRLLSAWGEGSARPRLTHRLDRDTSGVLLLAKTPDAAAFLAGAFARRRAQKTYWALVEGEPRPADGTIDLPLAKVGVDDRERMVPADPKDPAAKPATTDYATLSRAGREAAWLALRPHTGRTHQLRAHLLAVGHPILGDPKYNTPQSKTVSADLQLQLHARRLVTPHPSGGAIELEAPLSPEMAAGFARFGFEPAEALSDPFADAPRREPRRRKQSGSA
jgi:23S rRNA pseudouridine955/2504/2580 synthase